MNDPSKPLSSRGFPIWPPPLPDPSAQHWPPPPLHPFAAGATMSWKPKKKNKKPPPPPPPPPLSSSYRPPALKDLQRQNRAKARRFYSANRAKPQRKFSRWAPYAPRNTSSFIMRAKRSGGIASLVSPSPVTPAVLPTPRFSPSREGTVDMAKEEWGVDGYGSMKGIIRLREDPDEPPDDEDGSSSGDSDVEEHAEVERRLDHDLSRFEMVYPPNYYVEEEYDDVEEEEEEEVEDRGGDRDAQITRLEEENLTLKERLFLMENEMGDLRRRLQVLERGHVVVAAPEIGNDANVTDEVDEVAGSDNDVGGDVCSDKSIRRKLQVLEGGHVVVAPEIGNDANVADEVDGVPGSDNDVGGDVSSDKSIRRQLQVLEGGHVVAALAGEVDEVAGSDNDVGGDVNSDKSIGDCDDYQRSATLFFNRED